jgi:hypothetical protein
MSVDLTDVYDTLQNVINTDDNVDYSTANTDSTNYAGSEYNNYTSLEDCKTAGSTIDANYEETVNENGYSVITFADGTTITYEPSETDENNYCLKTTAYSNGTTVYEYNAINCTTPPDYDTKTVYSDGTVVITYNDAGYELVSYSNGLQIKRYIGETTPFEIYAFESWVAYDIKSLFDQIIERDEYTSESIGYMMDVYRYWFSWDLTNYDTEDFNSYFIEYILATIMNDSDTLLLSSSDNIYKQIFNAIYSTVVDDQGQELSAEDQITPSDIIKGTKYWNYITAIISVKNEDCPRFPLTTDKLTNMYNNSDLTNKTIETISRNNVYDLEISDLEILTILIDEYVDEPPWKELVQTANDVMRKNVLMGGTSLNNGESLYFGNYELYVGDTTIEFIVYPAYYDGTTTDDYGSNDEDSRSNLMSDDVIETNYDGSGSNDFSWVCNLPEGTQPFFSRGWWLNTLASTTSASTTSENSAIVNCDSLNSFETLSIIRNNLSPALYLMQTDFMWEDYIIDFDEQINSIYDSFFTYVNTDQMGTWRDSGSSIDTTNIADITPIVMRDVTKSNSLFYTNSYDIIDTLSEKTCYDFIKRNLGGITEKAYIRLQPTIVTSEDDVTYENEPNWGEVLSKYGLSDYKDLFESFWELYFGDGDGDGDDSDTTMQETNDKIIKNQIYESKGTQPRKIFSITHPSVTNIDKMLLNENGELYIISDDKYYLLVSPDITEAGTDLYNCRMDIDNVVGPRIVDGNNDIIWAMLTHDTEVSTAPINVSETYFETLIKQMYFFPLSENDKSTSNISKIINDNDVYGNNENGYILSYKLDGSSEKPYLQFGNFILTLTLSEFAFKGYSSYTGDLITLWSVNLTWDTTTENINEIRLVQEDDDVYIKLYSNRSKPDSGSGSGSESEYEIEVQSFSEMFNYTKTAGYNFAFSNVGPSIRFADVIMWHPLFQLNNIEKKEYFNKYTEVGYITSDVMDSADIFNLDNLVSQELFTNKKDSKSNNHKNNNNTHNSNNIMQPQIAYKSNNNFVFAPSLLNDHKPYLLHENQYDTSSKYSKTNVKGNFKFLREKSIKSKNDIETFDNMYSMYKDENEYYNKYRCKINERDCIHYKTGLNNKDDLCYQLLEDTYSIQKITLWCILLVLLYIALRKRF